MKKVKINHKVYAGYALVFTRAVMLMLESMYICLLINKKTPVAAGKD